MQGIDNYFGWRAIPQVSVSLRATNLCGRQIENVKFVFYFYTNEIKDTCLKAKRFKPTKFNIEQIVFLRLVRKILNH